MAKARGMFALPLVLAMMSISAGVSAADAVVDAGAAVNQSCPLPRHAVASEDAALDRVIKAVAAYRLLSTRRISIECVEFVTGKNDREPRYSVDIREHHSAQCGGDPDTGPRVMSINVASNGSMTTDAYDLESDQPLRCPKHGESTPEDVVYDFYRWYLTMDRASHDPIFNQRKQIAHYVARNLLHRADINQWTCDYDYFVSAQRFDPVWINTIDPERISLHGNTAKVRLTLGERAIHAHVAKLTVTLKKEGGAWKITDVHDDAPEHWAADDAEADAKARQGS